MKKSFGKTVSIFICIMLLSCQSNNTTEPQNSFKDPKSYTWKKDSLYITNNIQLRIDGFLSLSSKELYAYGHSAVDSGQIWKYDGSGWKDFYINKYFPSSADVKGMWGNSSNNLWLVGTKFVVRHGALDLSGYILQYNGITWQERLPEVDDKYYCVSGDENNIWVGGTSGRLHHFDGNNWITEIINTNDTLANKIYTQKIIVFNNDLFVTGRASLKEPGFDGEVLFCLRKTGNQWYKVGQVKRLEPNTWGVQKFFISPDKKLYSVGPYIYKWGNNSWDLFFSDNENYLDASIIDNKILIVSWSGITKYYDGSQWLALDGLNKLTKDIELRGVLLTSNEAFIVGCSNNRLYTFHGE